MALSGNTIRKMFLDFFKERGHTIVPSSGLIPKDDPTLLFTNAGMVQFKDCFLGLENRGYTRAASSQKCVRAGGKHNDLENVGYTARHHTFFEMLGNFSFGDYFKRESICWGWEFLTERIGLPKEKLWVTVYQDDDEAYAIWRDEVGVPEARIVRMGMESNFWMMGESGPCGPCSEILFDQGKEVGCGRPECDVFCDCDRHLEIWNHVFTQYDRATDGTLSPLPKPNIDTGMGLERLTAVVQGVTSNYDTDFFLPIISFIATRSHKEYPSGTASDASLRVIADHARAITFLIADGVMPSNEGRGYTLRRILRRAARHSKLLGMGEAFLHEVVPVVIATLREAYPDIVEKEAFIKKIIHAEEERFGATLDSGLRILDEEATRLKKLGKHTLAGDFAFKLYDSCGFPLDLTEDILRKDDILVDREGFEQAMAAQREKSREAWQGSGEEAIAEVYKKLSLQGIKTTFCGHETLRTTSTISAILRNGTPITTLAANEQAEIFVSNTPFYGEKGGQCGDVGSIQNAVGALFRVIDTQEPFPELTAHIGILETGTLAIGENVTLQVNEAKRTAVAIHHSATHLLNAALRNTLGAHVHQAGSLVNDERLRFDFTHFAKLTETELTRVEELANAYIRENESVSTLLMDKEAAISSGACAVFGEKYENIVRVVNIGKRSSELCGGNHVQRTGDIGIIKIISETALAAGIRRIEALAGAAALEHIATTEKGLSEVALLLKVPPQEAPQRIQKLLQQQRELEKTIEKLQSKLALQSAQALGEQIKEVRGVRLLVGEVGVPDVKTLRELGDRMRDKVRSGIVLLASKMPDNKAMLLCLVTKDLVNRYNAGAIIKQLAPMIGGAGGGKAEMAQAGGDNPQNIPLALGAIEGLL